MCRKFWVSLKAWLWANITDAKIKMNCVKPLFSGCTALYQPVSEYWDLCWKTVAPRELHIAFARINMYSMHVNSKVMGLCTQLWSLFISTTEGLHVHSFLSFMRFRRLTVIITYNFCKESSQFHYHVQDGFFSQHNL